MTGEQLTLDLGGGTRVLPSLGPGAALLAGFGLAEESRLLAALARVTSGAPFRRMVTPGGLRMSVAMTSCGALGWISDRGGYRYAALDPESGRPWPAMAPSFRELAIAAGARAGFTGFEPDTCLVNRYEPGARLTLHQDKNERDFDAPIVSVSLGLSAVFLWGGVCRKDPAARVPLVHGDVLVWGGPSRLRFHGVLPLREGRHPRLGSCRVNLTFRKAG